MIIFEALFGIIRVFAWILMLPFHLIGAICTGGSPAHLWADPSIAPDIFWF